jgi:ankyrin repeat protein
LDVSKRVVAFLVLALAVLGAFGLLLRFSRRAQPGSPVFSSLVWAAREGRTGDIEELIRSGADPNRRDEAVNGWTPLHHAVHKNQPAAVRALLAAGADVDRRAPNGLTPLGLAAAQGEAEIVEVLLDAGADPRAEGPHGWSVLNQAVGSGDRRVVEALLRKDPALRLGDRPQDVFIRGVAWIEGNSELLEMVRRGGKETP